MRYLFGFLCVCALGVMPLAGCALDWGGCWDEDCEPDNNPCTFDGCQLGSCVHEPYDNFVPCGDDAVCFEGACVELTGNCTMADLDPENRDGLYFGAYGCGLGIGGPLVYEGTYDCYRAWADAADGTQPECVDFVTNCYFQNPEATLTRDCYRCVASGYCCANLCADSELASCPNQMFACMLGEQALPSGGGGGRCAATQLGDTQLAWFFAALALIAIWRTFRRDENSR
jgi:hypothetical protein